jgi:Fic family protein
MQIQAFDPNQPNNSLSKLPLELNYLDPQLLVQLNKTNVALATLNGNAHLIPNQKVLIEFSSIKEGVFSSQVENIHTTIEEAFIAELTNNKQKLTKENKETLHYKDAIFFGYEKIGNRGKLTINDMIKLNTILLENKQGILSSPHKRIV